LVAFRRRVGGIVRRHDLVHQFGGRTDVFLVLHQVPEPLVDVLADFEAVAAVGGTLYSPFKKGTPGAIGGIFEQMFHFFCLHRDEFLKHCHLRPNVESTFSMVKRKFGDSVRAKTDTAMKDEALCKFIAHNVCCRIASWYELGIEPVFAGEDDGPRDVLRFPVRRPS
jgi:hypothetical protein